MGKKIRVTETQLRNIVKHTIEEQSQDKNYVLPKDTRVQFARNQYVKMLQNAIRQLGKNEANEYNLQDPTKMIQYIVQESNKLLGMMSKPPKPLPPPTKPSVPPAQKPKSDIPDYD